MAARASRSVILALALSLLLTPAPVFGNTADDWYFIDVSITPNEYIAGQILRAGFTVVDGRGVPVSGLRTAAVLRPPSDANDDVPPPPILTTVGRTLPEPGRYEVTLALNQPGRWWLELRVQNATGNRARYDHFLVVSASGEPVPAPTEQPLFLRGDEWDAYYRVDPVTGSVTTISGQDLLAVGDRWWVARTQLTRRGSFSPEYGGVWRVEFNVADAVTGEEVARFDAGDVRAGVYPGSQQEPAIATSLSVSPDGSAVFLYWARQLGEGWLAFVAVGDPVTGEIINQRMLRGAINGNGFWAEIDLMADGRHLVITEQVVRAASISGYRLSVLESTSLDPVVEYRRTDAREDPLTYCMLTYPGPVGVTASELGHRYGLCSPPGATDHLALVVWDPLSGQPVHQVDLGGVARESPAYVDGVASQDGRMFYAVNTRTLLVAEIDMLTGVVLRETSLVPETTEPSTLDRIFDWFFGTFVPQGAAAASRFEPSLTIDPDNQFLYVVARPDGDDGDGIWIIDLASFQPVERLFTGKPIDGIVATANGQIAVIQRGAHATHDEVIVIDHTGQTQLMFYLPGRSDVIGSRR
jgi:hypothetical protein